MMLNSLLSILLIIVIINDVTYGEDGIPAEMGQFKFPASVWRSGSHACGGAIITDSHILTAGHCIAGISIVDLRVLVGIIQVTNSTKWHWVESTYLHKEYELKKINYDPPVHHSTNDIGIVKLFESLVFDATIQPIPVSTTSDPSYYYSCGAVFYRAQETASIHVINLSLRWTSVVISSRNCCTVFYPHLFENQLCAFNSENPLAPTAGDSGSPIICRGRLFGIIEGAIENVHAPLMIYLVAPYTKFIEDVIHGRM